MSEPTRLEQARLALAAMVGSPGVPGWAREVARRVVEGEVDPVDVVNVLEALTARVAEYTAAFIEAWTAEVP